MAHIVTPLDLPSNYKDHQNRNVCSSTMRLSCNLWSYLYFLPQSNNADILAKSSTLYVRLQYTILLMESSLINL